MDDLNRKIINLADFIVDKKMPVIDKQKLIEFINNRLDELPSINVG